jgi:hypothetical protein
MNVSIINLINKNQKWGKYNEEKNNDIYWNNNSFSIRV